MNQTSFFAFLLIAALIPGPSFAAPVGGGGGGLLDSGLEGTWYSDADFTTRSEHPLVRTERLSCGHAPAWLSILQNGICLFM